MSGVQIPPPRPKLMTYLQNKTALVTGSSSGIGFEIVKYLSKFDMQIIITARREDKLLKLKEEVETNSNSKVIVLVKDLAKSESPQEIYDFCQNNNYKINIYGIINYKQRMDDGMYVSCVFHAPRILFPRNWIDKTKKYRQHIV